MPLFWWLTSHYLVYSLLSLGELDKLESTVFKVQLVISFFTVIENSNQSTIKFPFDNISLYLFNPCSAKYLYIAQTEYIISVALHQHH